MDNKEVESMQSAGEQVQRVGVRSGHESTLYWPRRLVLLNVPMAQAGGHKHGSSGHDHSGRAQKDTGELSSVRFVVGGKRVTWQEAYVQGAAGVAMWAAPELRGGGGGMSVRAHLSCLCACAALPAI